MSTRATMLDSARLALQDRAQQAATIRDSLTKIERSANAIPDQIETAAERLTTLATALATLISESEAALQRHQAMTDAATIASERMQAATIEINEAKKALTQQAGTMETMRGKIVGMSNTIVAERDQVVEASKDIVAARTDMLTAAQTASRRQWTTRQALGAVIAAAAISSTLPHWPAWIAALIALATR